VGRHVPEKGFHDLIAAFRKIDSDWKLVMVGAADHEDDYSRSLKQQAAAVNNIVMTGFQKGRALGELYSNAGLFVLPSYHEGLPIVALEAMSYNLPMLLSDIPANREVVSPGETFPVGDVDALAEKLSRFIRNPAEYFEKGIHEERRKRLETEFNWDIIARKTLEVYASVKI
jgi:glycosyltransferase involved in cell wall biosynthesis